MSVVADELLLLIRAEVSNAVAGLQTVQRETEKTGSKVADIGEKFKGAGKKMTAFATLPIVGFLGASVAAINENDEAVAKLNASIESMNVTWTDTSALQNYATELMNATTHGDEAIINSMANLLTFGNVTEDQFMRAQQVILDISDKMGNDLVGTTMMVGKALNDPVRGLNALRRVGIQFTEEQIEQIQTMAEAGDMAGAQAVMLGELERQFKGTSQAVAQTAGGQMKQAMNAFGEAMETVGAIIAPILKKAADAIKKLADWFQNLPGPVQTVIVVLLGLVAAIGPLLVMIGSVMTVLPMIAAGFAAISAPVLGVVAAVAAAIAIGVLLWKNWDKVMGFLRNLVQTVWDWIKTHIIENALAIWENISTVLEAIWNVVSTIFGAIKAYIEWWVKFWVAIIGTAFEAAKRVVQSVMDWLWPKIKTVLDAVKKGWQTAWTAVKNFIKPIAQWFTTYIVEPVRKVRDKVVGFIQEVRDKFVTKFGELKSKISGIFSGIKDSMTSAFKGALNWIIDKVNWGINKINGLIKGFNKLPGPDISLIPRVPKLGFGGTNLRGGMYTVGDRGRPETVVLPEGSSVKAGPGGPLIGELHVYGGDAREVARDVGWELIKRGY